MKKYYTPIISLAIFVFATSTFACDDCDGTSDIATVNVVANIEMSKTYGDPATNLFVQQTEMKFSGSLYPGETLTGTISGDHFASVENNGANSYSQQTQYFLADLPQMVQFELNMQGTTGSAAQIGDEYGGASGMGISEFMVTASSGQLCDSAGGFSGSVFNSVNTNMWKDQFSDLDTGGNTATMSTGGNVENVFTADINAPNLTISQQVELALSVYGVAQNNNGYAYGSIVMERSLTQETDLPTASTTTGINGSVYTSAVNQVYTVTITGSSF